MWQHTEKFINFKDDLSAPYQSEMVEFPKLIYEMSQSLMEAFIELITVDNNELGAEILTNDSFT